MARKPTEGQVSMTDLGEATVPVVGGQPTGTQPPPPEGTVILEAQALVQALRRLRPFSSQRSNHPVLQSVKLVAEDQSLRLTVSNGEQWMTTAIPAKVGKKWNDVCLRTKDAAEIVGEFDGRVTLKMESAAVVSISDDVIDVRLLALPAGDFPDIPEIGEKTHEAKIDVDEVRKVMSQAGFAVSDDMSRAYLTGIFFSPHDKLKNVAVATDTHRLAVTPVEYIEGEIVGIVPENAMTAFSWAQAGTVAVYQSDQRIDMRYDGYRIVSDLLTGQYPNWERVVPAEFTRMWTVDRRELARAIRRAMTFGRDNANRIRFAGIGDIVKVSGRSEDRGEIAVKVPIISKNGQLEIAFNGRYVIDALNSLQTEGAVIEMTEPARPAVIRPIGDLKPGLDPKNFVVVMPMALG